MSGGVSRTPSVQVPPGSEFAPQEYIRQDSARKIIANMAKARHPGLEGIKAAGARGISRRIYPLLVELKIAGRSAEEIAQKLKVSTEVLRPHLQRAMEEFRAGRLRINGANALEEARAVGEERGAEFNTSACGAETIAIA